MTHEPLQNKHKETWRSIESPVIGRKPCLKLLVGAEVGVLVIQSHHVAYGDLQTWRNTGGTEALGYRNSKRRTDFWEALG
jgi:hypothetical protein